MSNSEEGDLYRKKHKRMVSSAFCKECVCKFGPVGCVEGWGGGRIGKEKKTFSEVERKVHSFTRGLTKDCVTFWVGFISIGEVSL